MLGGGKKICWEEGKNIWNTNSLLHLKSRPLGAGWSWSLLVHVTWWNKVDAVCKWQHRWLLLGKLAQGWYCLLLNGTCKHKYTISSPDFLAQFCECRAKKSFKRIFFVVYKKILDSFNAQPLQTSRRIYSVEAESAYGFFVNMFVVFVIKERRLLEFGEHCNIFWNVYLVT